MFSINYRVVLVTIIFIIVVAIAAFFIHSHKISSINVKIDNLEFKKLEEKSPILLKRNTKRA